MAVDLRREIEDLVLARNTLRARRLILPFLRASKRSPAAVVEAADWLRRLGLYKEALKVLRVQNFGSERLSNPELFKLAQILALMGASEFAVQIIGEVELNTAHELRVSGHIHLDLFNYKKALALCLKARKLDMDSGSYASRLALVSLADAYCGERDYINAHAIVDDILRQSSEPLLLGICRQAKGEYFARDGKKAAALRELKRAVQYFPTSENTVDSAFLNKWLGFVLSSNNAEAASAHFAKAEKILRNPNLRPEAFLDLLRVRAMTASLGSSVEKRLWCYPGSPTGFHELLRYSLPESRFAKQCVFRAKDAEYVIDFTCDEVFADGKVRYGIPIELRLVGYLRIVGEWGLSSTRLKSLLWQQQVYSFIEQENRLHALIHRLRRIYKLEILFSDSLLRLASSSAAKIGVVQGISRPPSLVRRGIDFGKDDVVRFYEVGTSQAKEYLRRWLEQGFVKKKGQARATRYYAGFTRLVPT